MNTSHDHINRFVTASETRENPQREWLVDYYFTPDDKSKLVADILACIFGARHDNKIKQEGNSITHNQNPVQIYIPGIGQSHIAKYLVGHGWTEIRATDIDEKAIAYQRSILPEITTVAKENVLTGPPIDGSGYDVVIDSSFSDVFFAHDNSGIISGHAQAFIRAHLKPQQSIMIILSIFHKRWLPYISKYFDRWYYVAIEQHSGNRRNPQNLRRDIALFVCVKGNLVVQNLPVHPRMVAQPGTCVWAANPSSGNDLVFTTELPDR